jgi:uncharacterized protein (TIGR03437 family)
MKPGFLGTLALLSAVTFAALAQPARPSKGQEGEARERNGRPSYGAPELNRWAVILADPPLAQQVTARRDVARAALSPAGARLLAAQRTVEAEIQKRGLRVTGSTQTLLNAVFVSAAEEEARALESVPGVARVVRLKRHFRHDAKAADLVNAPAAWSLLGGNNNAGAGMLIGILDTGIDQRHPAFQDASLRPPAGFPKCSGSDCAYTSNKVIAARSYVAQLVGADEGPDFSRPDDLSPRDRVGHGTAAASVAAGQRVRGPAAEIQGVAPKAFLGNYKIFGAPGVNDSFTTDVLIDAIEDAFNDGMDVISISAGSTALFGPLEQCRNSQGQQFACDPDAAAVEEAVRLGMSVVVSAGNSGDVSVFYLPTLGTIDTPGTAPSVVTVGAVTNSHYFVSRIRAVGNAPAEVRQLDANLTNGPKPLSPLTAPVRDVAALGNDGKACTPLGNGSLTGTIALIVRGDCAFQQKVNNAAAAGAVAVIFYRDSGNFLFPISGLDETGIPAVLIGNRDGLALKNFLRTNRDASFTIDPALVEINDPDGANIVASFSSYGPSTGENAIKPEVVAVGTDMYMATQTYDPNGDMHSPNGYFTAQGTSFSAPQVAGAIALAQQRYNNATPGQLKSLVVNTANPNVDDIDENNRFYRARAIAVGAGKLDVAAALRSNVAAEPSTVNFGLVPQLPLPSRGVRFTNLGTAPVTLRFTVQQRQSDPDNRTRVVVTPTSINLAPGANQTVTVQLQGTQAPLPGNYEGWILVQGGAVDIRVPYLYLNGDNVPFNAYALAGDGFVRNVNSRIYLAAKVVDRYGAPVVNQRVTFRALVGGGRIVRANGQTDALGIAETNEAYVGSQLGFQSFEMEVTSNLRVPFEGRVRERPLIRSGGVVNAASNDVNRGLAPGSLITIYGNNLAEAISLFRTPYLPLALANVSVSFDVPNRRISVPGRLHFVSPTQINVQIPWELQGVTSAQMKVSIGYTSQSDLFTVTLNDFSPALFEYSDNGRVMAAALDQTNRLVSNDNPVARGQVLQIYANGLGAVDNQPASGEASSTTALSPVRTLPTVTIGGVPAQVIFAGLAPGSVIYQVNVVVPANAPTGLQPVVVTQGGVTAKTVNTAVR